MTPQKPPPGADEDSLMRRLLLAWLIEQRPVDAGAVAVSAVLGFGLQLRQSSRLYANAAKAHPENSPERSRCEGHAACLIRTSERMEERLASALGLLAGPLRPAPRRPHPPRRPGESP